ncbi:DUF1289 domain-containing protein [Plasticicumulans acidivorans]|uniref:Fe-S protein YdhL (DUF1289 family) n=1 Tax=Plasticicumulans acidivorans TaxID=886464 RepID=A0A317MSP5_9GAMM|nr:DUF1289 domain-containing protein [Plasticicumulans acidivorans]PWV60164.1 hypothetical protein C7443_10893 [Plasticicumulans acidivorans]
MNYVIEEPASPCIGICQMNTDTGLCEGCFRTSEEIEKWWELDAKQKWAVVAMAEDRQARILDGTYFD